MLALALILDAQIARDRTRWVVRHIVPLIFAVMFIGEVVALRILQIESGSTGDSLFVWVAVALPLVILIVRATPWWYK